MSWSLPGWSARLNVGLAEGPQDMYCCGGYACTACGEHFGAVWSNKTQKTCVNVVSACGHTAQWNTNTYMLLGCIGVASACQVSLPTSSPCHHTQYVRCLSCWTSLCCRSTMNASGNVQPAVTRLREVTEALKAAHQQGLLEVFKATVTHLCEVPTSHYRQPLVTMSIDKWKSLAGKDPGFDKIRMTEHDSIFVPGSRTQSGYRQVSKQDSFMKPIFKAHAFDYMATAYASPLPSELACVVLCTPTCQVSTLANTWSAMQIIVQGSHLKCNQHVCKACLDSD